jgi:hypothetical protein
MHGNKYSPQKQIKILSCDAKFALNIIEINKATHENMHTNAKTFTYRLQESKFKVTQTSHVFLMCSRISKHER